MGQPNKKSSTEMLDEVSAPVQTSGSVLREVAVAIDPPPEGAVGISELLDRLDFMAKANFFSSTASTADLEPVPTASSSGWNIFEFSNTHAFADPLEITAWSCDDLQLILRQMLRIQKTGRAIAGLQKAQISPFPVFASEALLTGISRNILPNDQVIGSQRLLRNFLSSPNDVFSSIANATETQRGTTDNPVDSCDALTPIAKLWNTAETTATNILDDQVLSNPIVICNINAQEIENSSAKEILRSFDDRKFPMLFICDRLLQLRDQDRALRDGDCNAAKFADEHGMEWAVVDGNDVLAVANASSSLIDRIRKRHGVGILEAAIFRQKDDPDISISITRLKEAMIQRGDINDAGFEIFETLEQQIVNTALTNACAAKSE